MKHHTRIILSGMIGNLIEGFDIALTGLLSIYFLKYLVEPRNSSLLILFLTFFVGHLARPLGAAFLGLSSDLYGRRITLAISIVLMGLATSCIALIPSYQSLGFFSVLSLLCLRGIQSFFCGAEYLNASAYLVENARMATKGFTGSWAAFGAMLGLLLASIASFGVSYCIQRYPHAEAVIWRIPFILVLFGSFIGFYIRFYLPESLEFVVYYAKHEQPTLKTLIRDTLIFIRNYKKQCLYAFFLSLLGVFSTFEIYIYAPMQAKIYHGISDTQSIFSNIISLTILLAVFPVMAKLSDKFNRKTIVFYSGLGLVILSYPYFYLLGHQHFYALMCFQVLISLPAAAYYAVVPVVLVEMFPLHLRCTVLSVLYASAASFSAGLMPLIPFVFFKYSHQTIAASWVMLGLFIVLMGLQFSYRRSVYVVGSSRSAFKTKID